MIGVTLRLREGGMFVAILNIVIVVKDYDSAHCSAAAVVCVCDGE